MQIFPAVLSAYWYFLLFEPAGRISADYGDVLTLYVDEVAPKVYFVALAIAVVTTSLLKLSRRLTGRMVLLSSAVILPTASLGWALFSYSGRIPQSVDVLLIVPMFVCLGGTLALLTNKVAGLDWDPGRQSSVLSRLPISLIALIVWFFFAITIFGFLFSIFGWLPVWLRYSIENQSYFSVFAVPVGLIAVILIAAGPSSRWIRAGSVVMLVLCAGLVLFLGRGWASSASFVFLQPPVLRQPYIDEVLAGDPGSNARRQRLFGVLEMLSDNGTVVRHRVDLDYHGVLPLLTGPEAGEHDFIPVYTCRALLNSRDDSVLAAAASTARAEVCLLHGEEHDFGDHERLGQLIAMAKGQGN